MKKVVESITERRGVRVRVPGAETFISAVELTPAHGIGLDGITSVKSLRFGRLKASNGRYVVADGLNNTVTTDADEAFALAQHLAREAGYELSARRLPDGAANEMAA